MVRVICLRHNDRLAWPFSNVPHVEWKPSFYADWHGSIASFPKLRLFPRRPRPRGNCPRQSLLDLHGDYRARWLLTLGVVMANGMAQPLMSRMIGDPELLCSIHLDEILWSLQPRRLSTEWP